MPTRPRPACTRPRCTHTRPCPDHPASWTEGQPGRTMPPGWPATRARILARDPWCWCGAPATEVHHLAPPGDPARDQDEYLRGLCHGCHLSITERQAAQARAH